MNKKFLISTLLFLFLYTFESNSQVTLASSTNQNDIAVLTSQTSNTWANVVSTAPLALTDNAHVLVEATIEVDIDGGRKDIEALFRLTDGSLTSQTITRFIKEKSYNDKGIISISYIFEYTSSPGTKTFNLQHAKNQVGNQSDQFSSRAVITAIEIVGSNITLPNGHNSIATIGTTSTTYEAVTGTSAITLNGISSIYLVSTFSTATTDNLGQPIGEWSLRESTDGTTFTTIPDAQIERTILDKNSVGSATIVILLKDQAAGDYYFDLAHKVNTGTNITTQGATISALALTSTDGHVFEDIYALDGFDDTNSSTYSDVLRAPVNAPNNGLTTNDLFMRTSFNMTATADIEFAKYKFETTIGTFTPFEIERYTPAGTIGTGGLIGLITDLKSAESFEVSFEHADSGASGNTLSTYNVNALGFYLSSSPLTWEGDVSSDWHTAENWDYNRIPSSDKLVIIPSGTTNSPIISTANAACKNLTIAAGVTLTVEPTKGLEITGTATNNGDLILESDDTGTAFLLNSSSVANVTQQRYLSSNQRGWRLLSNPLSTITFGTLGVSSKTPFDLGTNASGIYNSASDSWTNFDDANDMESQKAYKVFIRGRSTEVTGLNYSQNPPNNVTVSMKGTASNTALTTINTTNGEYYLVANPFTAPVSVKAILGASSNLSSTVSYYNPTIAATDPTVKAGGYDHITIPGAATFGSDTDVVLPPLGAVFVQASANGTIAVPKSAIYTDNYTGDTYTHKPSGNQLASSQLKIEVFSNKVLYDRTALYFKKPETAGSNVDFGKMQNTLFEIYSITDENKYMAVSELELAEQIIPLGLYSGKLQNYTIRIAENTIPSEYQVVLKDKLLNRSEILSKDSSYNFDIIDHDTSQGDTRFELSLELIESEPFTVEDLEIDIKLFPNPAHQFLHIKNNSKEEALHIEIYTLAGKQIHAEMITPNKKTTINVKDWMSGIYVLRASRETKELNKKIIVH